jgi:hypothetical protein
MPHGIIVLMPGFNLHRQLLVHAGTFQVEVETTARNPLSARASWLLLIGLRRAHTGGGPAPPSHACLMAKPPARFF